MTKTESFSQENKIVYSATIEDQENYKTDRERQLDLNSRIYKAIRLIKEHGDSPENNLKITADENGGFRFTADGFELDRFKADVYGSAECRGYDRGREKLGCRAGDRRSSDRFCIYAQDDKSYTDEEKAQYGLSDQFEQEEVLELVSVRYALSLPGVSEISSCDCCKRCLGRNGGCSPGERGRAPGRGCLGRKHKSLRGRRGICIDPRIYGKISRRSWKKRAKDIPRSPLSARQGWSSISMMCSRGRTADRKSYI